MSEKPPDKGNTNGVKPEGSKSDEEPTALEAGNSASCSTASALLEESKRGEEFARLEARNNASGSTSGVKPEGSKSDEELAVLEAGNSASWNTSGALPGESKSDEELAVLEAGNNASCSGSSVKPEGSQSDEEPTVLEAENNASSVVRELTIKSSELQHPTERGSTTADTDPHESGELELSQTRLAIQLSREVLRGYPTDKLEELVKELGRKFEIFGPEDLICLTDAQLDEIETVKTVQKRKLRSYVKRIQTDGATSGNFNEPTHSEDTNTEGMAVPVGAAPSGLVPEAKQADKIQPPRTPFQSSSQNFPKAERWEDAAGNEDGDWTPVGSDIFINRNLPLCATERSHVYEGKQALKVYNEKTERRLAVKIFQIIQENTRWAKHYIQEVKNMTNLTSHPNVAQFIHCGKVDESQHEYYIAMVLHHKKTLAGIDLIQVTPEEGKNIFIQICNGLEHLHTSGPVAHMDLKPSNVLFALNYKHAVVSDFGLSKEVEIVSGETGKIYQQSSTSYGGTQGWMANEMIRMNQKEQLRPDYLKADIFSLGLVGVYTLCENHHPFSPDPQTPGYDPTDQNDSACWHMRIKKKQLPFFGPLKDPLAVDLFEKMLSHIPEKRPKIAEVKQHCMFWSSTKRLEFLKDMFGGYFREKKSSVKQAEKHRMARKMACIPITKQDSKHNPASGVSSGGGGAAKDSPESTELNRIQDVISECWMERVEESIDPRVIEKMKLEEQDVSEEQIKDLQKRKKGFKEYSLKELLRYSRNRLEHVKYESVEDWVETFPKLIPYLIEIMEPVLTDNHREKYIDPTQPGDINLSRLLGSKL